MRELDETLIRRSFVNASRKEVADLKLPAEFDALEWESLDYLGWRDPKIAKRAYLVLPTGLASDGDRDHSAAAGDGLIGVMLRQAEAAPRTRAQCSWCQDVRLPNDVVFYAAKRAGAAGRNGNTIGTLICSEFQCSANVRTPPPPAYIGYDIEAARQERIAALRDRVAAFALQITAD